MVASQYFKFFLLIPCLRIIHKIITPMYKGNFFDLHCICGQLSMPAGGHISTIYLINFCTV